MLENVTHNINTTQGQMCSNLFSSQTALQTKIKQFKLKFELFCLSLKQVLIFTNAVSKL